MYIFGGDRHLMAFNDLYSFDLDKGLTSIDLYRSSWAKGKFYHIWSYLKISNSIIINI